MTTQARLEALKELGVRVHVDYRYVGEGQDRHREELPHVITGVFLPLTGDEWTQIAMREGQQYIGGCCGNTSAMQDRINLAFRDGGWIDAEDLLYIGTLARQHDGFDEFDDLDDERFDGLVTVWRAQRDEGLPDGYAPDIWGRLGVIYNAVEPYLKPSATELPHKERDDVQTLLDGLARMSWEGLFAESSTEGTSEENARLVEGLNHQHDANALLTRAKILDPCRRVLAQLEANDERFEGFALVAQDTGEVLVSAAGSCVYRSRAEAQRWLDLMNRYDDMEEEQEKGRQRPLEVKADVVPCTVTVAHGLVTHAMTRRGPKT